MRDEDSCLLNDIIAYYYDEYYIVFKLIFSIFIFILLIFSFSIKTSENDLRNKYLPNPTKTNDFSNKSTNTNNSINYTNKTSDSSKTNTTNKEMDSPKTNNSTNKTSDRPKADNAINQESNLEKINKQENEIRDANSLKICLCVIAKNENKYIREFVEFYKSMKVDKIFLYDNNDENGERFDEVISDYISSGYVEVANFRGFYRAQHQSYQDCYRNHNTSYDWFIFYDVDEFIYLKDFKDIKSFVNHSRFKNCERIQLNWVFYTDNNLLYYDNRPVLERFTEKEPNARRNKRGGSQEIKTMIRGNNSNVKITCIHVIDKNIQSCDGFGNKKKVVDLRTLNSDYEYYYLRHYYSKSTEEFIEKINRTDAVHDNTQRVQMNKIKRYFTYSTVTKEKLDLIEKRTNLDLSSFRYRVKKRFLSFLDMDD